MTWMQNTEVAFLHVAATELFKGCWLDLVLYVVKLSKELIISLFFPWLKKITLTDNKNIAMQKIQQNSYSH